jgi:SAM-dependent methyltransferase
VDEVWERMSRQWRLVGPPLRPVREDVAFVEEVATRMGASRALLLGVTPEIAMCAWPVGTHVTAVDASEAMIALVWPAPPGASAVRADWRALPVPDAGVDLIAGDGSLNVMGTLEHARELLVEARRALRRDGALMLRIFVGPDVREDPRAVVADLRAGRVATFDAFRWRLLASLASRDASAPLAHAWSAWRELVPDGRAVLGALGWNDELALTLEAYRDSRSSYVHPTRADLHELARGLFTLEDERVPSYALGERFATFVYRAT